MLYASANLTPAWYYVVRENTPEHRLGRNGELLADAMYRQEGFRVLDVAAAAIRGAPLLRKWECSIVAPDGLMVRNGIFWNEVKTKKRPGRSDGGPRGIKWVQRDEKFECVGRPNYHGYWRARKETGLPVVVTLIDVEDGLLMAATLEQLGEPYPSLQPNLYDVVNFPQRRFRILWEFDRKRLASYFHEPPEMKTERRMRRFAGWLRPRQYEFDYFRHDLILRLERQWTSESNGDA
jgi:hypothetical protein